MVESIVLVDLKSGTDDKLRTLSLGNAKQLSIGRLGEGCVVLHVAANTTADLQRAVVECAAVEGVTGVTICGIRMR